MPKAYSYKRFSSPGQMEGDSLRRQTEKAEIYAAQHNLELDTTLTLHDLGVSAFKGANIEKGNLGMFIKAIDDGIVLPGSYLLVENLDRISRQEVDIALEYFLNITRKGISIVTLDDGMVYSQISIRDNWPKLITAIAFMAGAHEQSRIKAIRVGDAWAEKRKNLGSKRLTKIGPEWLRPTEVGGWEVIEEKANSVRRIFELYADGYGKDNIAKILNKEGMPSLTDKGWYGGTVSRVLTSKAVIGEFQAHTGRGKDRVPSGEVISDYFPRIVDEDLYQRSQRPKKGPSGKNFTEMTSVFRKLVKCPKCGGTMTLYTTKQRSGKLARDFACFNVYRSMCDHKGRWRYENFLDLFLKFVSEVDISKVFADTSETKNAFNRLNTLRTELEDLEKKAGNIALSILDDPSPTLNKILRDIERDLDLKKDELANAESDVLQRTRPVANVMKDINDAIKCLEEAPNRIKFNTALHQIISKIEIYPKGTGINIAPASSDEVILDTTPRFTVTFRNGAKREVKASGFTHAGKPNIHLSKQK